MTPLARFAAATGTALLITFALTPLVRWIALRGSWIDRPTEDRWGRRVVARLGGVAIFAGFAGAALAWVPLTGQVRGLLIGLFLVFCVGLADDLRRMRPYTKLVAQLVIGCFLVFSGISIDLSQWPLISIPLSVLWFVLVMNAFNLLDNMDGLSAGVGAIAAGFCAVHAAMTQQWTVMLFAGIVSGSCLGFLRYNFPPARIYMGDSGSHLLGLSLAAIALMGSWQHSTQLLSVLVVPTLVLAVPIFDTCFVTIQRLAHRLHPFSGGTDHVSHRLAVLGLSTRQTVLTMYGMSACLGLLSVASASMRPLTTLAVWLSVLTSLLLVGRFLGQVNVYRIEGQAAAVPDAGRPTTLIRTMLLHKRRLLEILVDFGVVSSAFVFAHLLRFEGVLTADLQRLIVQALPLILVIKLACFAGCGLYQGIWRYLSLPDLLMVGRAVTLASLVSALALVLFWRFEGYSRSVLIIDWMLCLLAVGGSRVAERLLDGWIGEVNAERAPVLVIGAGDTGERVLRYLRDEAKGSQRAVAVLDDDPRTHGSRIHGCQVLGGRERLPEALETHGIRHVFIAITDPPGELLAFVRQSCEPRGVTWKVVTAGVTDAV